MEGAVDKTQLEAPGHHKEIVWSVKNRGAGESEFTVNSG